MNGRSPVMTMKKNAKAYGAKPAKSAMSKSAGKAGPKRVTAKASVSRSATRASKRSG